MMSALYQKKLPFLLGIFFLLAFTTFFVWQKKNAYPVNGDEPHYLIMTNGILHYHTLEQTQAYKEEFMTHKIYKAYQLPADTIPSPYNTHAFMGPHGLYNVHNIGLPLLLTVPFFLSGVKGAQIFMILFSGLMVVFAWKISGCFMENKTLRALCVGATCFAYPFIPAANQVYPDLLAGIISLAGLYWLMTSHTHRPLWQEVGFCFSILFLPWLQIKFAATAMVIIMAMIVKSYFSQPKNWRRMGLLLAVSFASFALLAFYNNFAFNNFKGPYFSHSLEISPTSLMVLSGLFMDQNHGFLLHHPLMFVGLFYLGYFFKYDKFLFLTSALVFLSLIVPNGLHVCWYGGGSFVGRFQWAATIVFFIPTLFGLTTLAKRHLSLFKGVITISLLLQTYFFILYTFRKVNLYNTAPAAHIDEYPIFYEPLHTLLPALHNVDWAYGHAPNYLWFAFIVAIGLWGCYQAFFKHSYQKIINTA